MANSPPPPSTALIQSIIALDAFISLHLHTFFRFVPRILLKSLEISGDGRLNLPILISLLFLISPSFSSPHPLLLSLFIGSVLDLVVIGLIKHVIRRPRPVYNKSDMSIVVALDHWSFPSGHSSRVFFLFSFLYLSVENVRDVLKEEKLRNWALQFADADLKLRNWILRFGDTDSKWRNWVLVFGNGDSDPIEVLVKVVFMWAVATSASRVLLGRHFVADVGVGACLGLIEGWIAYRFIRF